MVVSNYFTIGVHNFYWMLMKWAAIPLSSSNPEFPVEIIPTRQKAPLNWLTNLFPSTPNGWTVSNQCIIPNNPMMISTMEKGPLLEISMDQLESCLNRPLHGHWNQKLTRGVLYMPLQFAITICLHSVP